MLARMYRPDVLPWQVRAFMNDRPDDYLETPFSGA
jgi:hypothetical protein